MHSTCEDVKRILGIKKCATTFYDLKEEEVFIYFSESTCEGKPPGRWNIPIGTVITFTVYPKMKPKFVDLHIDESKFTKARDPEKTDFFHYVNYEEGFSFFVRPDGEADGFEYFGTKKDEYLRCPNHKPTAHPKPGDEKFISNSPSKSWRDIVPMHSTCEDAKRVLGLNTCKSDEFYSLNGDKVKIGFTKRPCDEAFGKRWNVPVGTITYIELLLEEAVPITKFVMDENTYKRSPTDVVGLDIYSSEKEGIALWVFKGHAHHIIFKPTSENQALQCSPNVRKQKTRKSRIAL